MELWSKRGHDQDSCRRLAEQLDRYRQGMTPFNAAFQQPFNLRAWWLARQTSDTKEIAALAILLASIVPHAAEIERIFSSLGLQQTKLRNRLSTHVNLMLTTIRMFRLQELGCVCASICMGWACACGGGRLNWRQLVLSADRI